MPIDASELRHFIDILFRAVETPPQSAAWLAETLVSAELYGHHSHGVLRAPWYIARIRSGATRLDTKPEFVVDGGAIAVLDGNDGIGQVIARAAMESAIDRAKVHGVGAVSVRNSGHFGTAMRFTRLAAASGCIGVLTTNASPAMAPWGGRQKRVGNNPWSIAAPTRDIAPMVLDIANTVVARGKIFNAIKNNDPIPEGWAIDAEGRPTTDPQAALEGLILPMAAHKGFAISTLMDVVSGLLSGSGFATGVTGPYVETGRSGVGHFALALDIARFRPLNDFLDDMTTLIERIKTTPKAAGTDEIYYPGEIEALSEERQRVTGIALPRDTVGALNALAGELGLAPLSV